MTKSFSIAVLLTCYNRREKTIVCLKSLFRASLPDRFKLEVFLVDDGSTDGTSEAVKDQFPFVNLIQGTGELFWNRGMSLAWKKAANHSDFDYYLWLNDDTYIFGRTLDILIQDSQNKSNRSVIVGTTMDEANRRITYGGYRLQENNKIIAPNDFPQYCDFFNGNIVLIPKYVFQKVGPLDMKFHHGLGDIDYGLRAKKHEVESYVSSQIVGYCEENKGTQKWLSNDLSFRDRYTHFVGPTGPDPVGCFILESRYLGLHKAIFHFITIHFRFLFRLEK